VLQPDLENHFAVVTGAAGGIGTAVTLALVQHGVFVCLVDKSEQALDKVASQVARVSSCFQTYQTDLTQDDQIESLNKSLFNKPGRVDILVHCAGIIIQSQLQNAPVSDFDLQYRVNVRSPYLLTQALLPMLKSAKGQIVFMNSSAGLEAKAGVGQYAATKHALKAIADSLRAEVNDDGIRVLSVFPGRTATPLQRQLYQLENREYHPELLMQPGDVAAVIVSALSLPRTAEVTDISLRPLLKSY
jgi:NADP-dependent 3-hydroxy acid dehydrogenase YdfG